jgi:colanic acid/amylovoran biosynthesis glycosyltransferase
MRLCFVLARFPELSQTFVLNQVLGLLESGHDVEIVAAVPGRFAHLHPTVNRAEQRYSLTRRTIYSNTSESLLIRTLATPCKAFTALLREPVTAARAFNVRRFGWFALTGSVLITGPLVTFFHAYDLTSAPRMVGANMYRTLFRHGELFLPISEHGASALRALGAPPGRIHVHHMGIDVDKFRPGPRDKPRSDRLRALSIGRLVAKKGFHDGIAAVARTLREGVKMEYRIIGEGPERPRLESLIRKLGVEQSVRLLGPAGEDAVLEIMHESDLLLAPSVTASNGDQEGIPMVLMEAQASGLPVIATRHGGIGELVTHGQSGILVPEADPPAIARALQHLACDPALGQQMGQRGRERVCRDFNLRTQNAALETLLMEFTRRPPHDPRASPG